MWRVPMMFAAAALVLEEIMVSVDPSLVDSVGLQFDDGAATAVLSAIAGSMMTVTGIVFSVLMLTVQYAGGAVSPRVVRTFYRDRVVKVSLGMFVGTFTYSLVLIPEVKGGETDFGVTIAVLLALISTAMFLVMVNHVGQGLRAASMVRRVATATLVAIDEVHPSPFTQVRGGTTVDESAASAPETKRQPHQVVHQGSAGVIMAINALGIERYAKRTNLEIRVMPTVGDFVSPGTLLFEVTGQRRANDRWLQGAIAFGEERTIDQDPAFGLRILADTAAKALSTGVNDPTTAVVALDQIHGLLRVLGSRYLGAEGRPLSTGMAYDSTMWNRYLDIGLMEAMHLGADTFQVTRRLRALLDDLDAALPEERAAAIETRLSKLKRLVAASFTDPEDVRFATTGDAQGIGSAHPSE